MFRSFGDTPPQQKLEMPTLQLDELTDRLDSVVEAIEKIQVSFEPQIEVAPAQLVAEIDLLAIETALQEIAAKEFRPEISVETPVTNNVYLKIGKELMYPLGFIGTAIWVLAFIEIFNLVRPHL